MRLAVLPSCIRLSSGDCRRQPQHWLRSLDAMYGGEFCVPVDVSGKNACRIDLANEKKNATACSGYDPGWNGRAVSRLAILEQEGVL